MNRAIRRGGWLAAVVFISVLVATAPVAAATATGSIHDSAASFSAGTLTDTHVLGDGGGAVVTYQPGIIDNYEDDDPSGRYSGDPTSVSSPFGTGKAIESNNGPNKNTTALPTTPDRGDTFAVDVQVRSGQGGANILYLFTPDASTTDQGYRIDLDEDGDTLELWHEDGGSSSLLDSTSVTLAESTTYNVTVELGATDQHTVTLYDSGGTQLAQVTATDAQTNGDVVGVSGGGVFDNFRILSGTQPTQGSYVSQNHTVGEATQGWTNLTTVNDVNATVTWEGATGGGWTQLDQTTYTTSGNKTVSLPNTYDDYRVNVTWENNGSAPVGALADEGVLFDNKAPTVDNSSASPSGNEIIQSDPFTLSIDVNDSTFATAQGDELTVEFFVDGNSVGTDTLTANGTASYSKSGITGGSHTWHAEVTDDYGATQTSDTFNFRAPENITVVEELDPTDKVDGVNVNLTVRFFEDGNETVIERTSTDGNISLAGLQAGQEYVVSARADGYHTRRVIITSLFDQQKIYLLNTSASSVDVDFVLVDRTNDFPADETRLFIKKPINESGNTTYKTISGDFFGAGGSYPATLETDQRYRIVVENDDGDRRVLGAYTTTVSETVQLQIGELQFSTGGANDTYQWDAAYVNTTGSGAKLTFNYTDNESETTSLEVVMYEQGNQSNEIYNVTHTNPSSLAVSQPLTAAQANKTWVVEFSGTRDGVSISGQRVVGPRGSLGIPLDSLWQETAAVALVIVIGGALGGIRPEIGAVGVAVMGGIFWYIQWLPGAVTGGIIAVAFMIPVLFQMRRF